MAVGIYEEILKEKEGGLNISQTSDQTPLSLLLFSPGGHSRYSRKKKSNFLIDASRRVSQVLFTRGYLQVAFAIGTKA